MDEKGRQGSSPQPSSPFDLTRPSRKLGGMPRAACLIRAESIEGIFHNEIVWPVEAAAPGFSCRPPQWVEGAYLSAQHTLPAGNSWGGTSPPNFDFPQSWTARDAEPRLTLAPSPRHITHMGNLRSKKEEIWSYSFQLTLSYLFSARLPGVSLGGSGPGEEKEVKGVLEADESTQAPLLSFQAQPQSLGGS